MLPEPWFDPTLFGMGILSLGGAVLGLFGLLNLPPARTWSGKIVSVLVILALVGIAVAAIVQKQPRDFWLPPLLLAALWAGLRAVHSSYLGRAWGFGFGLLRNPRLQGAALLALSPVLAMGWAYHAEVEITSQFLSVNDSQLDPEKTVLEQAGGEAVTDCGRVIPFYQLPETGMAPAIVVAKEQAVIKDQQLTQKLIRTAPADNSYNCHGWVFAAGLHWIKGEDVDLILHDNHYFVVASPRPGDVGIHRDAEGKVTHSALVRAASGDGLVLMESKWGRLGRFIHTREDQIYGLNCVYYRTSRPGGHTIQGADKGSNGNSSFEEPPPLMSE